MGQTAGKPAEHSIAASPLQRALLNGRVGQARRLAARAVARFTLFQQFMVVSLVILLIGAYIIGRYVSTEIEDRVIHRTSALTALYVDSVVSPHLQELKLGHDLSPQHIDELNRLVFDSALGEHIASFKVWHVDGDVVWSQNSQLIGRRFPIAEDLKAALEGDVATEMSALDDDENVFERAAWPRLLETYAPVRADRTGEIIGAVEFYQDPRELEAEIESSQRMGWLIVGGATAAMYVLLVGMVGSASRTISRQHRRLERLADENASLAFRVKDAAGRKSETDEQLLKGVAQDLHDGPAQDISLALLRLDAVVPDHTGSAGAADAELMHKALVSALREIRNICGDLRMPEIEALHVGDVIKRAVQDHRDKTGDTVRVAICGGLPDVELPAKIALYRVGQEALNNAHRHSGATEEDVRVEVEDGALKLIISDRGAGSALPSRDTGRGSSLGIRGMRERMEMLGGRLHVFSSPGAGTTVTAVLPLEET